MIITLTTDFGLRDPYVGTMKGVILSIAPEARLVDISHEIAPHQIAQGAFTLASAARYFPPGTVHLAIVDPGVGSKRRAIAASDGTYIFVGPDNGIFSLCLGENAAAYEITNEAYFLSPVSETFHGRDIFAPVAAGLASGTPLEAVGTPIHDLVGSMSKGRPQVLHVDRFGNVITNLRAEDLPPNVRLKIGDTRIGSFQRTYAEGPPGRLFIIVGSSGYVEVAMNQQSAADRLKIAPGIHFEIESENSVDP